MHYYSYFTNPHKEIKGTATRPVKTNDASFKSTKSATRAPDLFPRLLQPKPIKLGASVLKPKMADAKKPAPTKKKTAKPSK